MSELRDKIAGLLPLPAQVEKRNEVANSILSLVREEVGKMPAKVSVPAYGICIPYADVLALLKGG